MAIDEYAYVLLKACKDLLEKQNETMNVLNILEQKIHYDEVEVDGRCLLEDITGYLTIKRVI